MTTDHCQIRTTKTNFISAERRKEGKMRARNLCLVIVLFFLGLIGPMVATADTATEISELRVMIQEQKDKLKDINERIQKIDERQLAEESAVFSIGPLVKLVCYIIGVGTVLIIFIKLRDSISRGIALVFADSLISSFTQDQDKTERIIRWFGMPRARQIENYLRMIYESQQEPERGGRRGRGESTREE